MPKDRPKTGEARESNQPLKIDRLPPAVHDAILYLRNQRGLTWSEIEARSAEKYAAGWKSEGGGFVNWDDLPVSVLELFPDMRLPHTTLHRWHDLRVAQVQKDVIVRSAQARQLALAFTQSVVKDADEAVMNAARDTIMAILAEDSSAKGRNAAGRALIVLAEVMQTARANDIKERKVAVDERKMVQMEREAEARRKRMDEDAEKLKNKAKKGEVTPEDIDRLRERVFGLPPKAAKGDADDSAA